MDAQELSNWWRQTLANWLDDNDLLSLANTCRGLTDSLLPLYAARKGLDFSHTTVVLKDNAFKVLGLCLRSSSFRIPIGDHDGSYDNCTSLYVYLIHWELRMTRRLIDIFLAFIKFLPSEDIPSKITIILEVHPYHMLEVVSGLNCSEMCLRGKKDHPKLPWDHILPDGSPLEFTFSPRRLWKLKKLCLDFEHLSKGEWDILLDNLPIGGLLEELIIIGNPSRSAVHDFAAKNPGIMQIDCKFPDEDLSTLESLEGTIPFVQSLLQTCLRRPPSLFALSLSHMRGVSYHDWFSNVISCLELCEGRCENVLLTYLEANLGPFPIVKPATRSLALEVEDMQVTFIDCTDGDIKVNHNTQ